MLSPAEPAFNSGSREIFSNQSAESVNEEIISPSRGAKDSIITVTDKSIKGRKRGKTEQVVGYSAKQVLTVDE